MGTNSAFWRAAGERYVGLAELLASGIQDLGWSRYLRLVVIVVVVEAWRLELTLE